MQVEMISSYQPSVEHADALDKNNESPNGGETDTCNSDSFEKVHGLSIRLSSQRLACNRTSRIWKCRTKSISLMCLASSCELSSIRSDKVRHRIPSTRKGTCPDKLVPASFVLIPLPAILGILGTLISSVLEDLLDTLTADNHYHGCQVPGLWCLFL
jgi:hypothetical protein